MTAHTSSPTAHRAPDTARHHQGVIRSASSTSLGATVSRHCGSPRLLSRDAEVASPSIPPDRRSGTNRRPLQPQWRPDQQIPSKSSGPRTKSSRCRPCGPRSKATDATTARLAPNVCVFECRHVARFGRSIEHPYSARGTSSHRLQEIQRVAEVPCRQSGWMTGHGAPAATWSKIDATRRNPLISWPGGARSPGRGNRVSEATKTTRSAPATVGAQWSAPCGRADTDTPWARGSSWTRMAAQIVHAMGEHDPFGFPCSHS